MTRHTHALHDTSLHRPLLPHTPESRDGAEGARVVAALGHAQVSRVARREAVAVQLGPEGHRGTAYLRARACV
jgi:hypothetical protein